MIRKVGRRYFSSLPSAAQADVSQVISQIKGEIAAAISDAPTNSVMLLLSGGGTYFPILRVWAALGDSVLMNGCDRMSFPRLGYKKSRAR